MTFRAVRTVPDGVLVVGFLVHPMHDERFKVALPGCTLLLTLDKGLGVTMTALLEQARQIGYRSPVRLALVGYSAGCQGVRSLLRQAPASVVAAVTIDGTHADPTPHPAQVDPWRELAGRARRREALWAASCLSNHTYVESIPAGQDGRAMSTVRLLELVTGEKLWAKSDRPLSGLRADRTVSGRPAEGKVLVSVDDGALHLRSYASATTDHAEHAYQGSHVLPQFVEQFLGPWLGAATSDTDPAPPPMPHDARLGLRVLEVARSYLGLREVPGAQHNPTIQRMLAAARRGGSPTAGMLDDRTGWQTLGARPADEIEWCISSSTTCIAEAVLPGDVVPCGRRAACWEAIDDARKTGRWHDVASGYVPEDGDLEFELRAGGDPRIPGQQGHVGIREGAMRIDGNSANSMRRVPGGGPNVVGWISVSGPRPASFAIDDDVTSPGEPSLRRDDSLAVAIDRQAREALDGDG